MAANVVLIDEEWETVMAQRAEVVLSDEEREVLERWARRPKSSQALASRCRVVLAGAEGCVRFVSAAWCQTWQRRLSPKRDAARAWDRFLAPWHASGGMCNLRVT